VHAAALVIYRPTSTRRLCHPGFMFDPNAYGEEVAHILALGGGGEQPVPLAGGRCISARALELLRKKTALKLFVGSRAAEAALAGLYLYCSCWEEVHTIAQAHRNRRGELLARHRASPGAGSGQL
jgi:hypothetical protein